MCPQQFGGTAIRAEVCLDRSAQVDSLSEFCGGRSRSGAVVRFDSGAISCLDDGLSFRQARRVTYVSFCRISACIRRFREGGAEAVIRRLPGPRPRWSDEAGVILRQALGRSLSMGGRVRSRPAGYRTGTRTRRKPKLTARCAGECPRRSAARLLLPRKFQLPPRSTRYWPCSASVHCHTLPCISHRPSLFEG